jgi:nucleotide-binding universal stress UspA family protein
MYKSIMIPVADPVLEHGALGAGVRIAAACRARLHIVHVQEASSAGKRESEGNALLEAVDWAADELDESVSFDVLELAPGLSLSNRIAAALSGYAAGNRIDLIVMIRRRHSIHRLLFGSVGQRLLLTQDVPILFVPARQNVLPARGCQILAALDGTTGGEVVLEDAAQLARALNGTLTLIRVLRPLPHSLDESAAGVASLIEEEGVFGESRAQTYLDNTAERIAATGVKTRRYTLAAERIADTVGKAATLERVDVVALAPRAGKDALHFANGSVTEPLLQRARTALLLHRQRQG